MSGYLSFLLYQVSFPQAQYPVQAQQMRGKQIHFIFRSCGLTGDVSDAEALNWFYSNWSKVGWSLHRVSWSFSDHIINMLNAHLLYPQRIHKQDIMKRRFANIFYSKCRRKTNPMRGNNLHETKTQRGQKKTGGKKKNFKHFPRCSVNISVQVEAACFCTADTLVLATQHSHCVRSRPRLCPAAAYLTETV